MIPSLRIGLGFDVHKLVTGRKFLLGGIEIPCEKGPEGHSDADVLIHSICDALLGAAGLRDIGYYFPDTDPQFKDINSTVLLKKVCSLLNENKFVIGNIDTTIVLEEPMINPYVETIRKNLSGIIEISYNRISVKATTNEHMGYIGRKEGIAAFAVAMIFSTEP